MEIKALNGNVVVQAKKDESGLIIIPDVVGEKRPQIGVVVEVGPGRIEDWGREEINLKIGDEVVFSEYAPLEIKVSGEKYLIVEDRAILAVLK